MTKLTEFKTQLDAIEQQRIELFKSIETQFVSLAQKILSESPVIGCIAWSQYTPYFNDGDECIFHVHDVYAFSPSVAEWIDENGVQSEMYWGEIDEGDAPTLEGEEAINTKVSPSVNELTSFIHENEELMKDIFGDHVRICITRTSVYLDQYDHD